MPNSRQRAPQKGRRGQITRKRKIPRRARPRSIPQNLSKPINLNTPQLQPIAQLGPSKATIEKTLKIAHKHAKAGRKKKAALYYILAAAQAGSLGPRHSNVIDRRMMDYDYTSGPLADARGQVDWHLAYPKSNTTRFTRRKGWQRRKPGQKTGKKKGYRKRRTNKNRGGRRARRRRR